MAAADVVSSGKRSFHRSSRSVQFRRMQPLGNELRSGLQLSSIAGLAHAERLNASRAARTNDLAFLPRCIFYTSAEPCAMWARDLVGGIGRVYRQSEKALKAEMVAKFGLRPRILRWSTSTAARPGY
jgi:hypothetical protein